MRAIGLLLSMTLALAACSRGREDQDTARAAAAPRAVTVGVVAPRAMASAVEVSGVLAPREEAAVSSELTGYRVARVFADQNDRVARGQPLVRLDDTLLRADIAQQRAVLDQQRIAAEKAAQEAGRVAGLAGSGVLSAEAIAERKLAARTATATVEQAKAALDALLVRNSLMTIRAPVGGRVLARGVRPGDIAAPATVMFRIARDDLVELDAEVPEQTMPLVRAGQRARVTLPSGLATTGVVRLVSAEIDAQTKLGRARILMPADANLRPGGFAPARLAGATADALAVPEAAVRYDANGSTVVVVDAANRVRSVPVRIGTQAGGYVSLVEGPAAGTRVLLSGQTLVIDGDTVAPQRIAVGSGASGR